MEPSRLGTEWSSDAWRCAQKNDTFDGQYTVRSGIRDPTRLAQITAWEGKHFVSAWGGPTCNAVNGTQGDIFSPYITKDTTISVFSTDICRWVGVGCRGAEGEV